jgi:hypothetical protein
MMSWLVLPGYGDSPPSAATSPLPSPARSIGSSWLYSTLSVTTRPSWWASLQIAPTACFGCRGMQIELKS